LDNTAFDITAARCNHEVHAKRFEPNINPVKNICYMKRFSRMRMCAYASVYVHACVCVCTCLCL